jgi:uncharacterized protein DUF6222
MHHHELTLHTNDQAPAPAAATGDRGELDSQFDYDPPVGSLPRLYRGVVWSDIVAEINAEQEARKAA